MSNDPIRDVTARDVWHALKQSNQSGGENAFSQSSGHPDEVVDVVSIQANTDFIDRVKSSRNLEDVIGLLPFEKKLREDANPYGDREKVLERLGVLGFRGDEDYMFEAAREAMIELFSDHKGDLGSPERALITFASIFAQKVKEKERDPGNQPNEKAEIKIPEAEK